MDMNIVQQGEQAAGVQEVSVRPYTLRKLQAKDITPMAKIIGKIGIDQLISCYGDDDVTELMIKLKNRAAAGGGDNSAFIVGAAVAVRIANQVMINLDRCEQEVYGLLGSLSGMSAGDIADLELEVFIQMITDVVRENNVVNFIKAAVRFVK